MHEDSNTLQGFQGMLERLASIIKILLNILLLDRREMKTKEKGYQKAVVGRGRDPASCEIRPPIAYRLIRINVRVHRWIIMAGIVKIQVK